MLVDGGSQRTSLSSGALWTRMWYGVLFVPGPGLLHGELRVMVSTPTVKLRELLPAGKPGWHQGCPNGCHLVTAASHQRITLSCPALCDPVFHRSEGPGESDVELLARVPLCWLGAGLLLAPHAPFLHVALQALSFSCCLAAFYSNAFLFQITFPKCWGWIFLIFICFKAVHGLQA